MTLRQHTDFIHAVSFGETDEVRRLLDAGVDVNYDVGCWPALAIAAHIGDTDKVLLLIERGADINATSGSKGCTALMRAASNGYADTVRTLLDAGADVSIVDCSNMTALDLAKERRHAEISKMLEAATVKN